MNDWEDIQDRVISDERLIAILHEKDNKIYDLERRLNKAEKKLGTFVSLWKGINEFSD